MTGWNDKDLLASFPTFYVPFTDFNMNVVHVHSHVNVSDNLRVCKECFISGYHLVFHQIVEVQRCPIHRTPLTCHCPKCGNTLKRYFIDTVNKDIFDCDHCGNSLVNEETKPLNTKIESKKQKLVNEYRDWCASTNKDTKSTDGIEEYFSGAETFSHIPLYHRFRPLPTWVEQCIDFNHRAISEYTIKSKVPRHLQQKLKQYLRERESVEMNNDEFHRLFKEHLIEAFDSFENGMMQIFPNVGNSAAFLHYEWKGFRSYSMIKCRDSNLAENALAILREEVFELAQSIHSLSNHLFWTQWRRGPCKVLGISQNIGGVVKINNKDLMKLSTLSHGWFKSILSNLYRFILLKAVFISDGIHSEFKIGAVTEVASHYNLLPIFSYTKQDNHISARVVEPSANISWFAKLLSDYKEGFCYESISDLSQKMTSLALIDTLKIKNEPRL